MVYILGELRDARALHTLKTIMAEDDSYLVSEAVKVAGKMRARSYGTALDHGASSVFYGEG